MKLVQKAIPYKIETSTKYSDFLFYKTNRPIDTTIKKYRDLRESLSREGWIPSFPATCNRVKGRLYIVDGQNRFTAAQELGIPVVYVVIPNRINIAEINASFRPWNGNDYAASYAADGNPHFQKLIEFRDRHGISASRALSLLSARERIFHDHGATSGAQLKDGSFLHSQQNEAFAESIMRVCGAVPKRYRKIRGLVAAVSRVLGVEEVCPDVLVSKIQANEHMVCAKANVDEYIALFEMIYNKRNKSPVPIAMRVLENLRAKRNS